MRIAMIGQRGIPDFGGIEGHVEELSTRLVASGHEVIAYCRPHSGFQPTEHNGVRLVTLPTIRQKHLATLVHSLLATLDGLRHGVEVFHYHAIGPGILAPLPRIAGRLVITTVHGLDWQRAKWEWFARHYLRLSEWIAVRFSHRTIAVSRGIAAYLRSAYRIEPIYIPNAPKTACLDAGSGEEFLREHGLEPGCYLLYVGRLVPEKGCHYLIDAFRRARPRFDLVVVGAPTSTDGYAARLRATAPVGVRFFERVPDTALAAIYRHAYACVLPSDVEGLSLALLEMMAHGQCVIASNIPANAEIFQEGGEIGRLFEAGDVEDLSRALEWAAAHPEELRRLGGNAQRFVHARYAWDDIAKATEDVYLMVRSERGPRTKKANELAPERYRTKD